MPLHEAARRTVFGASSRFAAFVVPLALFVAAPSRALACGASGPDGVSACSLEEHEEATRLRYRVGVSGVATSTVIHFSGGRRAEEDRGAVLASFAYRVSPRVTLQAGAGVSLGGALTEGGATYDFDPGFAASLGASWRVLDAEGARPFVILSAQLAFLATTTHPRAAPNDAATGYEASDLRVGAAVGTTFAGIVSPYAVARVFGGPIAWRVNGTAVTGTDAYHYQLGLGVAVGIARRIDLFAEGVPLGERAVAAGAGVVF